MNKRTTIREALPACIPLNAVEMIATWFDNHHVILRITRNRSTKLGDFRGGAHGSPSYISVNHNLNKYSFLITLLHEIAHAEVHLSYSRRMAPHGKAWKSAFQRITIPFIDAEIFPEPLKQVFIQYLNNPKASSTTYLPLVSALRAFDNNSDEVIVSLLQPGDMFTLRDRRTFKVIEKLRKRYRCYCIENKKTYLFSPVAVIQPLSAQKTGTAD